MGVLFALCAVLSWLESLVTPLLALPPGVKAGLSNIVVMVALTVLSPQDAFVLAVLKSAFVLITRGAMAGLLSICGGLASVLAMTLLLKVLRRPPPSNALLGVCGAVVHNMSQLVIAAIIFGNVGTLYYAPVLIISGVITGLLTAMLFSLVQKIDMHNFK